MAPRRHTHTVTLATCPSQWPPVCQVELCWTLSAGGGCRGCAVGQGHAYRHGRQMQTEALFRQGGRCHVLRGWHRGIAALLASHLLTPKLRYMALGPPKPPFCDAGVHSYWWRGGWWDDARGVSVWVIGPPCSSSHPVISGWNFEHASCGFPVQWQLGRASAEVEQDDRATALARCRREGAEGGGLLKAACCAVLVWSGVAWDLVLCCIV